MANKDQIWEKLEKVEYWCFYTVVSNSGGMKWKERYDTIKMAAAVFSKKPGKVLLVSELKRNARWYVVSYKGEFYLDNRINFDEKYFVKKNPENMK